MLLQTRPHLLDFDLRTLDSGENLLHGFRLDFLFHGADSQCDFLLFLSFLGGFELAFLLIFGVVEAWLGFLFETRRLGLLLIHAISII